MYYTARDIAEFARRKRKKRIRNVLLGGAGVGVLAGGGLLLTRQKAGNTPKLPTNSPKTQATPMTPKNSQPQPQQQPQPQPQPQQQPQPKKEKTYEEYYQILSL